MPRYRRRVTSGPMKALLGKSAVEWSLKTRDPAKIVEAWKEADTRFEALLAKAERATSGQLEWDTLRAAAVAHGLAAPNASQIGPVDSQLESGRFDAFTAAALSEADKLTPQRMSAACANSPPATAFDMLAKAQLFEVERPPLLLSAVVEAYLRDRERRSSYRDLTKQANLVVVGLEEAIGRADPPVQSIDGQAAYACRDGLTAKGNASGTVQRRITTILNHAENRFDLPDWRNPFNKMELAQDDDAAGEVKRDPLTLDDIRKVRDRHSGVNEDVKGSWHLMMFTGLVGTSAFISCVMSNTPNGVSPFRYSAARSQRFGSSAVIGKS